MSAFAFKYALPPAMRLTYSVGMLSVAAAAMFFCLYKAFLDDLVQELKGSRWRFGVTVVAALVLSAFVVLGAVAADMPNKDRTVVILGSIVLNALPFAVALSALGRRLDGCSFKTVDLGWLSQNKAKAVFGLAGLILLVWLPFYLAAFPGYFNYDMNGSWMEYSTGHFTSIYPTTHELIACSLISFGQSLFGSFNGGVALFTALQAVVFSIAGSVAIYAMGTNGAPKWLCVLSSLFYMVAPYPTMFAFSDNCDTLSAVIALFVVTLLYLKIKNSGNKCGFRSWLPILLLVALLCSLRVNTVYAVILTAPIAVLCVKRPQRLQALASFVIALAIVFIWTGPGYKALGVESIPLLWRTAAAVPAQQVTYAFNDGALSDQEVDELKELGFNLPGRFMDQNADLARINIDEHASSSDFFKEYVKLGARHPMEYFYAFVQTTQAAWSPYAYPSGYNGISPAYEGHKTSVFEPFAKEPASSESLLPSLHEAIENVSLELTLQKVPILALLISVAFYVWLLVIVIWRVLQVRNKAAYTSVVLLVFLTLSVLVAPLVVPRYYLPLIISTPLLVWFILERPFSGRVLGNDAQRNEDQRTEPIGAVTNRPFGTTHGHSKSVPFRKTKVHRSDVKLNAVFHVY